MKLLSLHKRAFVSSVIRIIANPIEHVLNIFAVGIIIAILATVFIISENINNVENTSIAYPQIMVSMQQTAKASDTAYIEGVINKFSGKSVRGYKFISKEEGLKELQNDSDLKKIASDTMADMGDVVPDVLIINTNTSDVKILTKLKDKIANLPKVESVDIDDHYAAKVSDLISFGKVVIEFVEALFTIVLVMVVYNMIRLQMLLRQEEITVSRLIGASDAFVMRPLVYYALIQITVGAGIAFYLVNLFVRLLNLMFLNLNNLFGKDFLFHSLSLLQMLDILIILGVFSTFAVFIAVKMVFKNTYVQ